MDKPKILYGKYIIILLILIGSSNTFLLSQVIEFTENNIVGGNLQLGYSVANAGDVNGDSYPDIIVGAPGFSSNQGITYIYFGGPFMDDKVDIILSGSTQIKYFGYSVSGAGDVNGDGISDVIVGAPNPSISGTGQAYVYYGGTIMDGIPDVVLSGAPGKNFGYSVSGAGDVNGDGKSDIIVGEPLLFSAQGAAFIYYGGAPMDNSYDIYIAGASGEQLGSSVSNAGDLNGDGVADVIVGAPGFNSNQGKAYAFYGGVSMDAVADVTFSGETIGSYFGASVSGAGDVNGDNFSDVIIGASNYNSNQGRAYLFYGGSAVNNVADVTITGEATGNNFGCSVSGAKDLNEDGKSDIIVGASGFNSNTGRAYILYGSASMDATPDLILNGEATGNYFATSVAGIGDINSDGKPDIIISSPYYNSNTGRVYFYHGGSGLDNIPDRSFTEGIGNGFGYSAANAGDVNGDGKTDIIVGALNYNTFTGRAYIYYGGVSMNSVADVILEGPNGVGRYFGCSVAGAGDVNGDGYADILVGAYNDNQGGKAYIYFGGPLMDNVIDRTLTVPSTSDKLGWSVSGAGNVNGDGYSDVIIGAPGYNSNQGRAYIFYGGGSMVSPDLTLTGEAINNSFGTSVAEAGDVNGDGFSDVIVGAKNYSNGLGRAYIYYGGTTMNSTVDVTLSGEAANITFGTSVASAGNVNGDAYADVIVGAPAYNSNTGRAYIYYGGAAMDATSDLTLNGESTNSFFGNSVSGAGDINGDGNKDVIVGAYGYQQGKAFIYLGGPSLDAAPDIILTGESNTNELGWSVKGSGDINNDGINEVLISATGYPYNGKVYLYTGALLTATPVSTPATSITGNSFTAKWNPISGTTKYYLDVATDIGFTSFVTLYNNRDVGNVSSFTVTSNISPLTTYYYRIRAYSNLRMSNNSNIITLTTTKLDQYIYNFNSIPSKTYGDGQFTVSATGGASGNPVIFTSENPAIATCTGTNGSAITIVKAGTVKIFANQVGNATYADAAQLEQSLVINTKPIIITADNKSKTFGDSNPSFTYTVGTGIVGTDAVNGVTFSTPATNISNIGSYDINLSDATFSSGLASNYNITYTKGSLTVNTKTLTITADNKSKTYGDANPTFTFSVGAGLVGTNAVSGVTFTTPATNSSNQGSYDINLSNAVFSNGLASNYNITYTKGTLTVNTKALTITADNKLKTYGDANPTFTFSVGAGLVGTNAVSGVTFTTPATNSSNQGSYDINLSNAVFSNGLASNYNITYTKGALTVNTKALTITADNKLKTYGDANPTFTFSVGAGLVGTDALSSITLNTSATSLSDVGSYNIIPSSPIFSSGSASNYNINYANGTLTINKANQSINFGPLSVKTVADPDFFPGATASSFLTVSYSSSNLNVATIINGKIHIAGEGNSEITASQLGNINYNAATDVKQTLTITFITGTEEIHTGVITVYPNPSKGQVRIQFESINSSNPIHIKISDLQGKIVFSRNNIFNPVIELDLSDLNTGIYLVYLFNNNEVYIRKLLINK